MMFSRAVRYRREQRKVRKLLASIGQQYPECGFEVGPGWFPVVAAALTEMSKVNDVKWQLTQVKQKFCQLRIYYYIEDNGEDIGYFRKLFDAIVNSAETICDSMCEQCGAQVTPGLMGGRKLCGWCRSYTNFLDRCEWKWRGLKYWVYRLTGRLKKEGSKK